MRFSTFGAGAAAGRVIGGSAIGSLLGGWLAQNVGFNAINWMGVISAGLSVVLLVIYLWPAERRKRTEEHGSDDEPPDPSAGPHDVPVHA